MTNNETRVLHTPVRASFEGVSDDLSGVVAEYGVSSSPTTVPSVWYSGAWLLELGVWLLTITAGVGSDLPLAVGNNYVWIKFTHAGNVVETQRGRITVIDVS